MNKIRKRTASELALLFDHTLLSPFAREADFERVAEECRACGFAMMAVNSSATRLCSRLLEGSGVHVGAAVSFPLGQTTIPVKRYETENAIQNGAHEIDYVINLSELKSGNWSYLGREMEEIVGLCRSNGVISKVILETCYLTPEEIRRMCAIAREIRPGFVKTSTGFGTDGARADHVRMMKEEVGDGVRVKASGGIRTLADCLAMLEAGAERIGSSRSVAILEEYGRDIEPR